MKKGVNFTLYSSETLSRKEGKVRECRSLNMPNNQICPCWLGRVLLPTGSKNPFTHKPPLPPILPVALSNQVKAPQVQSALDHGETHLPSLPCPSDSSTNSTPVPVRGDRRGMQLDPGPVLRGAPSCLRFPLMRVGGRGLVNQPVFLHSFESQSIPGGGGALLDMCPRDAVWLRVGSNGGCHERFGCSSTTVAALHGAEFRT